MTNPHRHPQGAAGSKGGKFAPDPNGHSAAPIALGTSDTDVQASLGRLADVFNTRHNGFATASSFELEIERVIEDQTAIGITDPTRKPDTYQPFRAEVHSPAGNERPWNVVGAAEVEWAWAPDSAEDPDTGVWNQCITRFTSLELRQHGRGGENHVIVDAQAKEDDR